MSACPRCAEMGLALARKDQRIQELEAKAAVLEYDLKAMREKWFSRRGKKKNSEPAGPGAEPRKRGAPKGHPGWFRKKPERVDATQEVTLERCPDCGSSELSECAGVEEHLQEDIVLPPLKVTLYRRHQYWCKRCRELKSGRGTGEIPNSYIGPTAKALAAFLKYRIHVSQRGIADVFQRLSGLVVVPSSIPGFHNQIRREGLPLYEEIKAALKKAPYVHADETGNPVDGDNRWNWIFATTQLCLHAIRKSRGQNVVEEILGKRYDGILVSDFLSAYNKLDAKAKQRCLVHLLRDLKKALACSEEGDAIHTYSQHLKELIEKALALSRQLEERRVPQEEFHKQREILSVSLQDFQFPGSHQGVIGRLSKRLARHKEELFTFLYHPGLPAHNNHAEQLLRSSVILRKIAFGQRSENGVLNHNVLMSLQQTAQINGKDPVALFQELLCSQRTPVLSSVLGP